MIQYANGRRPRMLNNTITYYYMHIMQNRTRIINKLNCHHKKMTTNI
jgi:hypothetical protein